jgi:DNA-binding SARP family transcriptional activator
LEDRTIDYGGDSPYPGHGLQDTVDLLRIMQSDVAAAKRQLEKVGQTLADGEAQVSRQLRYAVPPGTGYRTLRLVPYRIGSDGSALGTAVLGNIPSAIIVSGRPRLEVRCLGRFDLTYGDKNILRWQSIKARTVCQYLMSQPRQRVVKEVLMESLWPGGDPRAAANNLKTAVHGLRQTLGALMVDKDSAPVIIFAQGSYLINPDIDLWVDVEEFERHWIAGRRFDREGNTAQAVLEYQMALDLYRGDYLQDEPYGDWTLLRRESLQDSYLDVLDRMAELALLAADYDEAIMYCQQVLLKDRCREDIYRRLMRCYSRLGQKNRARRWYDICRRTINSELDAEPEEATMALYRRLLCGEPI